MKKAKQGGLADTEGKHVTGRLTRTRDLVDRAVSNDLSGVLCCNGMQGADLAQTGPWGCCVVSLTSYSQLSGNMTRG